MSGTKPCGRWPKISVFRWEDVAAAFARARKNGENLWEADGTHLSPVGYRAMVAGVLEA